jgi:hypothetical protein
MRAQTIMIACLALGLAASGNRRKSLRDVPPSRVLPARSGRARGRFDCAGFTKGRKSLLHHHH